MFFSLPILTFGPIFLSVLPIIMIGGMKAKGYSVDKIMPCHFFQVTLQIFEHLTNHWIAKSAWKSQIQWYRFYGTQQKFRHRFPLYYLNVVVDLRAARTLLERFRSKSYDVNTQFTHVSRHPGTLSFKQK